MQFAIYLLITLCTYFGATYILNEAMTIGDFNSLMLYGVQCLFSLMMLGQVLISITMATTSVKRIYEILTEVPTIKDNDNFEIVDNVLYSKGDEPTLICYPYGKNDSSFRIKDGTKVIGEESFYFDIYVTDITIPTSVTTLNYCFISMYSDSTGASSLTLRYEGTVSEFSNLDFVGSWHESTSINGNVVICSDGNYSLSIM